MFDLIISTILQKQFINTKINININIKININSDYHTIEFVNLSMSCLGIFGQSSDSFLKMCTELGFDNHNLNFIVSKLSTMIIRTTYYIFCMRNKSWCNPELLSY